MHLTNQATGLKTQSSRKVFTRKVPFFFAFSYQQDKKSPQQQTVRTFFLCLNTLTKSALPHTEKWSCFWNPLLPAAIRHFYSVSKY